MHNTLLHINEAAVTKGDEVETPVDALHATSSARPTQVLLSTVIVDVRDADGKNQRCRALLDSGSQSCFMTEPFAKKLKLPLNSVNIPVTGISNARSQILAILENRGIHHKPQLSSEERLCEDHFSKTVSRNNEGRFIVNIPIKENALATLGFSKNSAEKRLLSLERKFHRDPVFKEQYSSFIHEFISLNHMKPACIETDSRRERELPAYYLPHHGVSKQTSLTTKLRVVFDGSAPSSSGVSLNDIQMTGPTLQQDLISIVMRFRTHTYVLTADIEKMYRQILIDPSQHRLQRILWRDDPSEEIKTYELATVTYGTSAASFLAIRALRQLAVEEQIKKSAALSCDYELPEQRCVSAHHSTQGNDINLFKYSKFTTLIRVTAYCLRYINNLRITISSKKNLKADMETSVERITGQLSTDELKSATNCLIKRVQSMCFPDELCSLQRNRSVNKKSTLISLDPFLDDDNIIRVGGRLKNASISMSQKHPIVIPKSHPFTKSQIEHTHLRNHHAGSQVVLAAIREQYWPVGGRSLVRQIIRKCVTCFKNEARSIQLFMGNLPQQRVTPSRPFSACGVDYFGPLNIRECRKRNYKTLKAYGAIFICFATKAVHIELATDLSTETFLGAMKRFIARRGKPREIFSDNGTNFTGANHELRNLREMFNADASKNKIISSMADSNINWHFIPARAPHFGGLWEAAVKSTKHHIRRVVGNALLTYEEMYTFLAQTEAILNSLPLVPLSNDPNDFSTLTPGHFLIGDSLTSSVEPDLSNIVINRLSRWQHVELLRQHFWSRWSKEYLTQLQVRGKWRSKKDVELQPGQLVLIREDNLPPLQWHMGRILQTHPGSDGISRAATIRTAAGSSKRPATWLCPLPLG